VTDAPARRRVVVLGGGITGLAAAWEASGSNDVAVTVLEASPRFGGKVRTSTLDLPTGPLTVDEGADNFLARVPDAVDLCTELGLADELTQPALGRAEVWSGGALHAYPQRHVLGVPLDVDDLAATGILSPDGLASVAAEVDRTDPAPDGDVSIGAFLTDRFGRELVDHVVGPLVGGINAGDVDELSMRAVTPQLADAAAEGGSLTLALRRRVAAAPPTGPVFRALLGGTERLVHVLAQRLDQRGVDLRTGAAATSVRPGPDGTVRIALADGEEVVADAVAVTLPAPAASSVLAAISPGASVELGRLEHVPVAFVAVAVRRTDVPVPLDASGVLVPRDAGLLMTATSFGSVKWPHWDDGTHVVLRVAVGHRHDDRPARMDDDELVIAVRDDLATVLGITAPPVATRVTRWSPGFAQYEVGHLERVARIGAALAADAPSVRVAGMDLGGLGLPACIRQGRDAARALLT
jgi:oxygen-dependent protoporphyrinogen oxidase